jgi:hypothetical protein
MYKATGGIRTGNFCSRGGCDVHCATPPGFFCIFAKKIKTRYFSWIRLTLGIFKVCSNNTKDSSEAFY